MLTGQVGLARRSVWVEKGEAELGGVGLKEALLCDVIGSACETGEVDEERRGLGG